MSPVICRGRAVRVTSVRALTPPKRTAIWLTERTASASAGSSTAGANSGADMDKAGLLLEEDRCRPGGLRRFHRRRRAAARRTEPVGDLGDAPTDAVGV